MYPVMIDFKGRLCTVIGGGRAALRKAKNLYSDGAVIRAAAPKICAELADMAHEVIYEEYSRNVLKNSFAAVAASDNDEVNRCVLKDCRSEGILCMSVRGGGDFEFCAKTELNGVTLAAHTGGEFPMLGALICADMHERYKNTGMLAELLGKYRRAAIADGQHSLIKRFSECVRIDMTPQELEKELRKIIKIDG